MEVKEYTELGDFWVSAEDGEFYIGLLPAVVAKLGKISFVDQIPMGKVISQDGVIGVIETEKAGDWLMKSPITGQVTKFNTRLNRKPELVNKNPIGEGWIVRCRIPKVDKLSQLGEVKYI